MSFGGQGQSRLLDGQYSEAHFRVKYDKKHNLRSLELTRTIPDNDKMITDCYEKLLTVGSNYNFIQPSRDKLKDCEILAVHVKQFLTLQIQAYYENRGIKINFDKIDISYKDDSEVIMKIYLERVLGKDNRVRSLVQRRSGDVNNQKI